MNKEEIKRKIEIHLETTNECIDNCNIDDTTKKLLEQDNTLFNEILEFLENVNPDSKNIGYFTYDFKNQTEKYTSNI